MPGLFRPRGRDGRARSILADWSHGTPAHERSTPAPGQCPRLDARARAHPPARLAGGQERHRVRPQRHAAPAKAAAEAADRGDRAGARRARPAGGAGLCRQRRGAWLSRLGPHGPARAHRARHAPAALPAPLLPGAFRIGNGSPAATRWRQRRASSSASSAPTSRRSPSASASWASRRRSPLSNLIGRLRSILNDDGSSHGA